MATKLHINVTQGVLDVEGDVDFIREMYREFRDLLKSGIAVEAQADPGGGRHAAVDPDAGAKARSSAGRRAAKKRPKKAAAGADDQISEKYAPSLVKDFDFKGLKEFYEPFEPKSHVERVLIFAKFLQEHGREPCTADEIYTCYSVLKERFPKAWPQALRDAHGKKFGYLDYRAVDDVRVTSIGENHFNHDLKRKAAD